MERDLAWAEKAAARRNKRRAANAPLLAHAGLLTPVTADDILRQQAAYKAQRERVRAEHLECANIYKFLVRQKVSVEEFARLEEKRKIYPDSPEYDVEHWWRQLKQVLPTQAYELCANRERHVLFAKWHEACPTCGITLKEN